MPGLQEISGQKAGGPLPHPLGHEGCGIVEAIGPSVTRVKMGDKVVMHWRKGAGIESEFPKYLLPNIHLTDMIEAELRHERQSKIITGGRVTTFMEQAICSENRLTAVPKETPDELCALLGCGLSTALATMENEAHLLRGESVLIVGCGGLGTNLILAAKLTGAWPIVVTDIGPKEGLALELGATEFWDFDAPTFISHPLRRFDVIVETSGNPIAIQATVHLLAPSGRYVMVGQPKPGDCVVLNDAFHFFEGTGKSLRATQGGGYRPDLDCVRFAQAFAHGPALPDFLISHRFPLSKINEALDVVRAGNASRVMVYMEE